MRDRRLTRRAFLRTGSLAGAALLAAACQPSPAPTAGPTQAKVATSVPPTAEPSAGQPVAIQLWSTAWFPSSIAGRMALVDKFNKEHEGRVKVDYIQGSWGEATTYIQSGVAAGGGIACVIEYEVEGGAQDWYRKGWIKDLRPYMSEEDWALMIEAQWKAREYPDDGAIIANGTVLWEPMQLVLYNPKHLEAASIRPATVTEPWSWAELIENAKLLTLDANGKHLGEDGFDSKQVVQWGFLPRLDSEKVWEWGLRFAQQRMGKPVVRQENGKWGWNLDEKGKQVYALFLSIVQEGVTPSLAIGLSGDSLHEAFASGKASMILRETFGIAIIKDNYPDFELAAMPTPFEKGDKVFYKAGGEGMVLVSTCDHPQEAAQFMFWMMKPENLALYAYGNGMLPANYAALDKEPFASDPTWDIIKDYLARGEVYTTPYNPHLIEFRDTVAAPTLMAVVEGKMSFDEANRVLEEQAATLLNQ